MKFFLDTANLDEIRHAAALGLADGVTTNPTLISKEGNVDFKQHIAEICKIVSAASKNVEFCPSDIGNAYRVSRTRQTAFTVAAVLPHSPIIPRCGCTWLFRIICNPEPAIGERLSLCRSYSRAIQNLREMVFARINAGIYTSA